jgi:hypothetical protein
MISLRTLLALLLILQILLVDGCAPSKSGVSSMAGEPLLVRQPNYRSAPGYCLLVFGRDPEQKIWTVLDQGVLYVDRNGNGDLTEPDERFEPNTDVKDSRVFTVKQLRLLPDAKDECSLDLTVDANGSYSEVALRAPRWSTRHTQVTQGKIPPGRRPAEAPVIHFGGPLTMTLMEWEGETGDRVLRRGGYHLSILVGTPVQRNSVEAFAAIMPGFGESTSAVPIVEADLPSKRPGERIHVRGEVKLCECGNRFLGSVGVPEETGEGKAIVTISYPGWTRDKISPANIEHSVPKRP